MTNKTSSPIDLNTADKNELVKKLSTLVWRKESLL